MIKRDIKGYTIFQLNQGSREDWRVEKNLVKARLGLRKILIVVSLSLCFLCVKIDPVISGESDENSIEYFVSIDKLINNFSSYIKFVGYEAFIDPADSTLNPHNDFLQIPAYYARGELRADFSLNLDWVYLGIKPRANSIWQRWEEGTLKDQEQTTGNVYVYEWLSRLNPVNGLFLSYGRENLQWGPSYALSPSNPFIQNNGQSNPIREVSALDFARSLWVINPSWSISLIANTGKGGNDNLSGTDPASNIHLNGPYFSDVNNLINVDEASIKNEIIDRLGLDTQFYPTYAVKADFTGFEKYFSLIVSYKEKDRTKIGAYAGVTVSDALLLYGEGSFSLGTDALYPVPFNYSPFGSIMMKTRDDSTNIENLFLLGGAYTLESGLNVVLEGIYNSAGYSKDEAERYYYLRRKAYDYYDCPYILGDLSKIVLYQTLSTKLSLLRKPYVLMQLYQNQLFNKLDLALRYMYNFDDNSSQLNPIVKFNLYDNAQLFFVGQYGIGPQDTEFLSLVDRSLMMGIEYTF